MSTVDAPTTANRGWATMLAWPVVAAIALSGCAVSPPTQASTSTAVPTSTPTSVTVTVTSPSPSLAPSINPTTASPTQTTPTPTAATSTATPSPTKTTTTATPKPNPADSLTAEQQAALGKCLTASVGPGSSGTCAALALKLLNTAGYYSSKTSKSVGTAGANAILNYQRSRGINPNAYVRTETWVALASNAPAVPEVIPDQCKSAGVVLCVDKAHRKLTYLKSGAVVKVVPIRVGGWNSEAKTGKWRVFQTVSGTYRVYNKLVNPPSDNYGSGAMPYSVMFDPNMYVHYSSLFRSQGYSTSSHGCVNVGNLADAKWFFTNTPIGAKVYVF
ncbi:MAG TPA: L,D-transpeptidase [Propioniciclava tarda]|nr:L,D-transpeptidase [Propioniciclava tarda]HQA31423.1 L,D-transpeptidase [Propioniciclava tarda]HQD61041.1 L,D-transpeptidase [Propioniciclava tarda]